ncbi:MAG: translocation/assembly module TamB domain-containing protein [Spirulinaceae cyanobacterium]
MTQLPNPDNEPESNNPDEQPSPSPRRRRRWWFWLSLAAIATVSGGIAVSWFIIKQQLTPQISRILTNAVDRPVNLGEVQSLTLGSVRFGETEIPPTTDDPDRAIVEAVDVTFDLMRLITERTLALDITLIEPDAYIEEDFNGEWLAITLREREEEGPLEIDVHTIRVRDGEVALVKSIGEDEFNEPIEFVIPSAIIYTYEDYNVIEADVEGALVGGGEFDVNGTVEWREWEGKVALTAQDLSLSYLSRLLNVPLDVQSGTVGTNVDIELNGNPTEELPEIQGVLTLAGLNAQAQQPQNPPTPESVPIEERSPFYFLNNLPIQLPAITDTNGRFRFRDRIIFVEQLNTQIGEITADLRGQIDLESGYDLAAVTETATFEELLTTFDLEDPPIPATGAVQVALNMTGPLDNPLITGTIDNTSRITIDKVDFAEVRADLAFSVASRTLVLQQFTAEPVLGGAIAGKGQAILGQEDRESRLILDLNVRDVPGDELAALYTDDLPLEIGPVSAQVQVFGPLTKIEDLRANVAGNLLLGGGTVNISDIALQDGRWRGTVRATGVQPTRFLTVPPRLQGEIGTATAAFDVSGSVENFALSTLEAAGFVNLNVAGGTLLAENLRLNNGQFSLNLIASGVQAENLVSDFVPPNVPLDPLGTLGGRLAVSGRLDGDAQGLPVENLAGSGSLGLDVASGTVRVTDVSLQGTQIRADVTADNVQLSRFANGLNLPPALARAQGSLGSLTGTAQLTANLNNLNINAIAATGTGRVAIAGGGINADFNLDNGAWRTVVNATGLQPQRLLANVQDRFDNPITGRFTASGTIDDFSPSAILAQGSGQIAIAGGTLAADNIRLNRGRLQAVLRPQGIDLGQLTDVATGTATGNINVTASLDNLSPGAIRADGQLNLSDGIAPINGPVAANFAWTGSRLQLSQVSAPNLSASGFIEIDETALAAGQISPDIVERFNLDVDARGLNLPQLVAQVRELAPLPLNVRRTLNQIAIAGNAAFDGTIRGTLRNPTAVGTLALQDLAVNNLDFDSRLAGPVTATPGEGISVDLRGVQDRIALTLGPDYRPESLNLQVNDTIATGTRDGDLFAVNVQDFPLALLQDLTPTGLIPPRLAEQPISGDLAGNFNVNLETFAASGNITVDDPLISRIEGDRFTASFQYAEGNLALSDTVFTAGDTEYVLDGNIVQTATGPAFNLALNLDDGNIQDVFATLQIFEVTDFANLLDLPTYEDASVLARQSIDVTGQPLLQQLRRLAEVEAFLRFQRQQQAAASPLPPLTQATGEVSGQIVVSGNLRDGIEAEFDFDGDNWQWGPFAAEDAIATGSFEDGVLTVIPVRLDLVNGGVVAFSGSIGGETPSGQLQVEQLPVALVQEFINLPADIGVTGFINATANLSGTQENPLARGQLTVVDATLNNQQIEATQGSFRYGDARLTFFLESILAADTEPLQVTGSFPYQFPLGDAVTPDSNVFNLNLTLANSGLAVLNALTNAAVTWEDGNGEVDLDITGRYDQDENRILGLRANGIISLDNAVVASLFLPEPVTNINGDIVFNLTDITAQDVRGEFGGGDVILTGRLPLETPRAVENPLTLDLDTLAVNIKGLYDGQVGGAVQLTGAVLDPVVGGTVRLSEGRVLLGGLASLGGGAVEGGGGQTNQILSALSLDNLDLVLADGLRLDVPLVLNFVADGTITLDGPVSNLAASGIVELPRGDVNLFATQLRLDRGYPNIASFRPESGLDPRLELQLVGNVIEGTRSPVSSTTPFSTEIRDSQINVGTVETVRVEAIVNGFASDLIAALQVEPGIASQRRVRSVLELESTPPRSEAQILALLGGGFINAFQGEDAGIGLANLAGNALFGGLQNTLGDALGLSEFRIYPSPVPDDDRRTQTFGVAAELGLDVTDNIGFSVTQFLTPPDIPTQVNIRYRLDDYVLLRGSTNFSGENRVLLEYRRRF